MNNSSLTESEVKSHFVKCSCTCQMLEIQKEDYGDGIYMWNLTMWSRGHSGDQPLTWRERFRWCWYLIKSGKLWADDIIVTNNDARGLAEFIIKNLPDEAKNKSN